MIIMVPCALSLIALFVSRILDIMSRGAALSAATVVFASAFVWSLAGLILVGSAYRASRAFGMGPISGALLLVLFGAAMMAFALSRLRRSNEWPIPIGHTLSSLLLSRAAAVGVALVGCYYIVAGAAAAVVR